MLKRYFKNVGIFIEEMQFPYQNNLIWLHGLKAPNVVTCVELKQASDFMHGEEFVTVILHSEHMYKQYKQQDLGALL